jgi:hypothetical protein
MLQFLYFTELAECRTTTGQASMSYAADYDIAKSLKFGWGTDQHGIKFSI